MATELANQINTPLREHITGLLYVTKDLVLLSEELSADYTHCKKLAVKMHDLNMHKNIQDHVQNILRAQKTLSDDFEHLHNDCLDILSLANDMWAGIQSADSVQRYNDAVQEWNAKMRSETVTSVQGISAVLAKNSRVLEQMLYKINAQRFSYEHIPDISSNAHDLIVRADKVPFYAERVRNNLASFTGYIMGNATALPQVEAQDFAVPGATPSSVVLTRIGSVVEIVTFAASAADRFVAVAGDLSADDFGGDTVTFSEVPPVGDYERGAMVLRRVAEDVLPGLGRAARAGEDTTEPREKLAVAVRAMDSFADSNETIHQRLSELVGQLDGTKGEEHVAHMLSILTEFDGSISVATDEVKSLIGSLENKE